MWKKVRKQGGLCTGITQNIVDLLMSETSPTMLSNSAFILLLNQSSKDIEKIVESLEISEEQLNYVIDSPSIYCSFLKMAYSIMPLDLYPKYVKHIVVLQQLVSARGIYRSAEKKKEIMRSMENCGLFCFFQGRIHLME